MKNTAKRRDEGQGGSFQQLVFAAMADARSTLHDAVVQAGMTVLGAMLEEDRAKLCGRRYAHDTERSATRAGYTDGELAMGGRRVTIERPRVRGANNREIRLPTWERFASADPLTPRAVEQMVLGVSTRNYARSIEPAPEHVRSRGTSKSAVSRRFVGATREQLVQMMSRDISEVPLCAVMIDGIHLAEHLVLVALGIDEQGEKHVLGLYEGAAENSTVCTALLTDLVARGMRVDRSMLFVIDGSKALAKAIRRVVGAKAILQRCQVHKRRNVEDHLPEDMKKSVGRTISAAYHSDNAP
jgi:putative transposase